ncbi:uncharacterized protein LOC111394274 [Olea europaea var. sylvestris]|uniref:uncharacterized protein LOC111394274 n=1 Tax=Olea europaea var. sylvestris TaxID=158386 RepID=UPI000C1D82B0|nr:uncharacterized protein LOC111394274 [Olea europaea var. sylvestris]
MKNASRQTSKQKTTISRLNNIPASTSLVESLSIPFDDRMDLIVGLIDPEEYEGEVLKHIGFATPQDCMTAITFDDEYLQLGSRPYNRPLYVSGYIRGYKMNRIMIDCGSAMNIMPVKTVKKVGTNVGDLSRSKIMIQGFNQKGQRAIGMIRLKLQIGELISSALFHVIDAKTSYELLFRCVWLHETRVVPSTWHQCFKYSRDGEVKCVVAESKPFLEEESHFADAKFYMEDEECNSVRLTMSGFKIKKDANDHDTSSAVQSHQIIKGKSKFTFEGFSRGKKPQIESTDFEVLKKEITLLIPSILKLLLPHQLMAVREEYRPTLEASTSVPDISKLYISSSPKQEGAPESKKTFKGCYNPQVKKLFENVGFGKGEPRKLGYLNTVLSCGRVPSNSDGTLMSRPRYGLGYDPNPPRKIKVKKVSSNPIMVQIYEVTEEKLEQPRPSVFDRIESENARVSVFTRLKGEPSLVVDVKGKVSIFQRLNEDSSSSTQIDRNGKEDEEKVFTNHVAFEEAPDSDSESKSSVDEPKLAPPTFEEGGQATVNDLKQLNLGIEEDPRPVFLSTLLSQKEEFEYISLLQEYKDVFAWSYKEMPRLNPKVSVHHLAIRHGVRLVKQPQRRFRPELIPQIEVEVNKLIEARFIREVKYPTWIANIVPVKKKNGQLRICVDFRDLNQACPKDDFPLLITELMVDATTGYEVLSFMDGFSRYNQIQMNPKD